MATCPSYLLEVVAKSGATGGGALYVPLALAGRGRCLFREAVVRCRRQIGDSTFFDMLVRACGRLRVQRLIDSLATGERDGFLRWGRNPDNKKRLALTSGVEAFKWRDMPRRWGVSTGSASTAQTIVARHAVSVSRRVC